MAQDDQTFLTIHGLDEDNRTVRADVFAKKLRALLAGLAAADTFANGKPLHRFVIADLRIGSAVVAIREKQRSKRRPERSGVQAYQSAVTAIYNGDRSVAELPPRLVKSIQQLGVGVEKEFAHAEVSFSGSNIIRIDDFLLRQSDAALKTVAAPEAIPAARYYRGLAIGNFDGVLRMIDARGSVLRAKLVTSAGAVEIDCVINKERIPEIREYFDRRVKVEGTAHYDGELMLPVRVDVRQIKPLKEGADLTKWRGSVVGRPEQAKEDW